MCAKTETDTQPSNSISARAIANNISFSISLGTPSVTPKTGSRSSTSSSKSSPKTTSFFKKNSCCESRSCSEKNAPDFTWYVDVIFKMLEYAPDSVNEDVWHRVVQVVTGNEEELHEELQQYSAQKAYSCLERYPHPTMVSYWV